jgi:hypothetical protein
LAVVAAPMPAAAVGLFASVRRYGKRPQSDALGCHAGNGTETVIGLDVSDGRGDEFRLLLGREVV